MWDITKINNSYDKISITTLFWHRAKVYFMCIKPLSMVVDHCTQYEQNPPFHFRYITTNIQNLWNIYHFMNINATIWHRAGVYFTRVPTLSAKENSRLFSKPNFFLISRSMCPYYQTSNKNKIIHRMVDCKRIYICYDTMIN